MRTKLGTFRYPIELLYADGSRSETLHPWVDTGALYSQFPAGLLEALGYHPHATRRFRLADGTTTDLPVGEVRVRLNEEVTTVLCVFAEETADPLIGATTLENFSLAVDPVNETLTPTVAMRLTRQS